MKMLSDSELFVQLCENCNIPAPREVLEKIKTGSTTGTLKLSSMSIVVPICEIVARVLASSSTIKTVDLGDCMLLSKGLSGVLSALCEGSNVMSLNLKGNNISGATVGQLGKIFLRNNTLKSLSLEWNSLGADPEEFAKFCDGLGTNHNIEELDLRYNQISPRCAESLAGALRANKSLRIVDLAWNALGLKGGELLLEAVRENRELTKLNLRGNCVPDEIIRAIDETIDRNRRVAVVARANMHEKCSKIAKFRDDSPIAREKSSEKESLALEDPKIVSEAKSTEDEAKVPGANEENTRLDDPDDKIAELNKMLQDRGAAIESLTEEIAARVKDAEAASNLVERLRNEISSLKQERETLSLEKSREIAELREIREKSDDHWQRECKRLEDALRESSSREKELENRLQRCERDTRKASSEMASLREKTVSQTRSYEDLIAKSRIELHRARREMKERENRHKIEISVLKNSLKESTEALEDCQAQLQKIRAELRETGDKYSAAKARSNELEKQASRLLGIEESHEKLKDEKRLLEEKSNDFRRTIDTLQTRIVKLQSELIEPHRRYELAKEELEEEREKNGRLKAELAEERARSQEQNSQIQHLNARITSLNNQINEIQNNHMEAIRELDRERKALKDVISNKERDFNDFKTEEVQRASQLYAAFSKYYLGSIGPMCPSTTLKQ